MEKGLEHDRKDMEYFTKKADNPRIQSLELQLLKVRIRQIKETITSKEDKLKDIEKTLESILRQAGKASKPEKGHKEETGVHNAEADTKLSEEKTEQSIPEADVTSENPEPKQATEPTAE
jgi:hypothetical protein